MTLVRRHVHSLAKTNSTQLIGDITLSEGLNVSLTQSGQDISIASSSNPTFSSVTISSFTSGSIIFAGTAGLLSQDNPNIFWDDTNNRLGVGTNAPNTTLEVQGQSRLYNQNFTYPTGGYAAITHSPTVTTVNNATPVLRFVTAAPTFSYETALSMGFATLSFASFSPTYTSAGAIGAGSDTGNLAVFNLIPVFNGATGPRTLNQMFGMFIQPRCNGGTVTTLYGFGAGVNNIGGTATTAIGVYCGTHAASAGGAITTGIGLKVDNQTVATTNWSMQIGSAQSYHVGALKLGAATAPTATYILDMQGNLTTSATIFNFTTITSLTFQDALARSRIYIDANVLELQTSPVIIRPTANVGSGTSLTTITPANGVVAGTELNELLIDMSSTKTWTAAPVALQRSLLIKSPLLAMSGGIDTFTEATTVSIDGPPNCNALAQITTSIGFKMEQKALHFNVSNGLGFVIYGPTGALVSNACGAFMNGNVGINTLSPLSYLDVKPTSAPNVTQACIDGGNRFCNVYMGGKQYTSLGGSAFNLFVLDHGINFAANTSNAARTIQTLFTLSGAVNYTGAQNVLTNTMTVNTSAGTATAVNANTGLITTTSVANITTARSFLGQLTDAATGTITTYIAYDTTFSVTGGGTVTDIIGFRAANPTNTASTVTNYTQVDLLDITATVGTLKLGVRQRGTNAHNRFNGDTSFAQDATPGAAVDIAGKMFITNAGLVTKYNNITTVSGGHPAEYATVDLTTQAAAIGDTTIYTPTATGMFRISIYLQVTRAASTSSVLGGATGVVIKFNDGDGNVAQVNTAALATTAGAVAVTSATNTTATNLEGTMVIYARTGVAISYAIGYTSVGVTTMQFAAHLKVEAL